ncbi:hypothetical protein PGTUg99_023922 [Puccinia graminis f. sp. tritici]|uniref:Uncharacterized protein n=1 Tax=Puccinia graminis f. sp. tritici TaxID=56615 RepID=A0A5B0RDC0_PUCGR|nr:hypothetical protein PGTUg99_023922 [Puccinia graminis f. sp. tritici]
MKYSLQDVPQALAISIGIGLMMNLNNRPLTVLGSFRPNELVPQPYRDPPFVIGHPAPFPVMAQPILGPAPLLGYGQPAIYPQTVPGHSGWIAYAPVGLSENYPTVQLTGTTYNSIVPQASHEPSGIGANYHSVHPVPVAGVGHRPVPVTVSGYPVPVVRYPQVPVARFEYPSAHQIGPLQTAQPISIPGTQLNHQLRHGSTIQPFFVPTTPHGNPPRQPTGTSVYHPRGQTFYSEARKEKGESSQGASGGESPKKHLTYSELPAEDGSRSAQLKEADIKTLSEAPTQELVGLTSLQTQGPVDSPSTTKKAKGQSASPTTSESRDTGTTKSSEVASAEGIENSKKQPIFRSPPSTDLGKLTKPRTVNQLVPGKSIQILKKDNGSNRNHKHELKKNENPVNNEKESKRITHEYQPNYTQLQEKKIDQDQENINSATGKDLILNSRLSKKPKELPEIQHTSNSDKRKTDEENENLHMDNQMEPKDLNVISSDWKGPGVESDSKETNPKNVAEGGDNGKHENGNSRPVEEKGEKAEEMGAEKLSSLGISRKENETKSKSNWQIKKQKKRVRLPPHSRAARFEKELKGNKQITEREEIENKKSLTKQSETNFNEKGQGKEVISTADLFQAKKGIGENELGDKIFIPKMDKFDSSENMKDKLHQKLQSDISIDHYPLQEEMGEKPIGKQNIEGKLSANFEDKHKNTSVQTVSNKNKKKNLKKKKMPEQMEHSTEREILNSGKEVESNGPEYKVEEAAKIQANNILNQNESMSPSTISQLLEKHMEKYENRIVIDETSNSGSKAKSIENLKHSIRQIYSLLFARVFGESEAGENVDLQEMIKRLDSKKQIFTSYKFLIQDVKTINQIWKKKPVRLWTSYQLDLDFMNYLAHHLRLKDKEIENIKLEKMEIGLFKMILFFTAKNKTKEKAIETMIKIYDCMCQELDEREAYRRILTLSKQLAQMIMENLKKKFYNSIKLSPGILVDSRAIEYERGFDLFGFHGLNDEPNLEPKMKKELSGFYVHTDPLYASEPSKHDTKFKTFASILGFQQYTQRSSPRVHFPPHEFSEFISNSNYMKLIESKDFRKALDSNGLSLNRVLTVVLILGLEEEDWDEDLAVEKFYYMAKILYKVMYPHPYYNALPWSKTPERKFLEEQYGEKYMIHFGIFLDGLRQLPNQRIKNASRAAYLQLLNPLDQAFFEMDTDLGHHEYYKQADTIAKRKEFRPELKDLDTLLPSELIERLQKLEED